MSNDYWTGHLPVPTILIHQPQVEVEVLCLHSPPVTMFIDYMIVEESFQRSVSNASPFAKAAIILVDLSAVSEVCFWYILVQMDLSEKQ
eukprot:scaffold781_cov99-Skeletonema_dohrnii-CCMP3373.AAC.2